MQSKNITSNSKIKLIFLGAFLTNFGSAKSAAMAKKGTWFLADVDIDKQTFNKYNAVF